MRLGRRSSAPPAATRLRLASGMPSLRSVGGDDQVAGQRDLHPARHGEPLDRCDQRLARTLLRDAREALLGEERQLALHEGLEVHAGAERPARAGEDPEPQLVGRVEVLYGICEALGHGAIDRVAGLGPVDRDDQDVVALLCEYCLFFAHGREATRTAPPPARALQRAAPGLAGLPLSRTGSSPARARRAGWRGRPPQSRSRGSRPAPRPVA